MDLSQSKIVVTGADGFIGSHLTEALVRKGCDVKAFVYYNSFNSWGWLDHSPKEITNSLEIFSGDIRDPYGVKSALQGCDVVFHLASLIAIPYSYHSPETYVDTNIKGTLNVLQAAKELNLDRVVHTSTSEVYGTAKIVPIDEDHPLQGQSPYSATKIAADQLALSFFTSFDVPITILRPFNTYGPRQSSRAIIPTIIVQLLTDQPTLKLGSLHPTRDLNYVKDTVAGFIAIASSDNSVGEVFNCGSGKEISMGKLAELISNITGKELVLESDDMRIRPEKSEVNRLLCDNRKIFKTTGFKPLHTLQEGLKKTINWFSDSENLKKYKAGMYNV
jgi:NAD dependent epimerase/dehydratase